MAKRKAGVGRLPVFLGVAAVTLGAVGVWIATDVARARREAAEAAKAVPTLPNGRLQLLHASSAGTSFLALDEVRRDGGTVSAAVLTFGRTVNAIEGGGAMAARRATFDCAAQRVFEGQVGTFDLDGRLIGAATGYAGKRGRPVEAADYAVPALCAGAKGRVVTGFRAAQREVQQLPEDYARIAEARPQDPVGWAWLCAAGARGAWRTSTPKDCARALALRPDDAASRLDRAFLFLKIGRRAEADADFARVLAMDPRNATALFGRSLSHALRGDETASRRDRTAALDLDEDVPSWVARTYQIQMSQEYRVR